MLVVGSEGFGGPAERDKSQKLVRAEELIAQNVAFITILTEDQFCRLVDVPTAVALRRQYHAVRDLLARYRSLREDHLLPQGEKGREPLISPLSIHHVLHGIAGLEAFDLAGDVF